MIRRTFAIANRWGESGEDDPNPMEMVANVSDVMLVLAVALMVALISRMGVSMEDIAKIDESNMEAVDVDISQDSSTETTDGSTQYEEVGTVYRDTETGELYVVGG